MIFGSEGIYKIFMKKSSYYICGKTQCGGNSKNQYRKYNKRIFMT
jgi:hypothetical protein